MRPGIIDSATLTLGLWYHLVGTFETTGINTCYINGIRDTNASGEETYINGSFNDLRMGTTSVGTAYYLDDIRMYSQVLTASDVLYIYSNTPTKGTP